MPATRNTTRTQLTIEYVRCHEQLNAVLDNLRELIGSMPAPDENGELPYAIDWAVLGDYKRLQCALGDALKGTE